MNPWRNRMKSAIRTAMVLVALLIWGGVGLAQHEGHQTGGAPTGEGACLAHAKEGLRIVEDANRQLEEARQVNSPPQMRAAVSELQAALAEIRTQLSLCVRPAAGGSGAPGMGGMDHTGMKGMDPPAMEGMDHSKLGQSKPGAPKSEKPPSAEMDHSKMGQSKPGAPKSEKPPPSEMDHSKMGQSKPAAPKTGKPPSAEMDHSKMGTAKPAAPKSEKPPSAGMDHSKMGQEKPAAPSAAQPNDTVDPVCGREVGTQATEKATYQGKTYYFCSRADRERFLSDPAPYVNR